MWTSVPQIEACFTLIRTSLGPTSGTGTSCISKPGADLDLTTACMVLLTPLNLNRRRAGAKLLRFSAHRFGAEYLPLTSSFRMVTAHGRDARNTCPKAGDRASHFHSPLRQHDCALDDRAAHRLFGL